MHAIFHIASCRRCGIQKAGHCGQSAVFKGGLLASMYLCQCIPLGFVFGSLPVIMRQAGVSLQSIGILFLLHLPWALKFFGAPWVDRWYVPALGRRRSWIFPLQWVGAGLLFCVAQTPPSTDFVAMYGLLLALNIVMATNDIAVDGYATDILKPEERAWGNTLQAGARFAGMILGSGLMLYLHESMGWQSVCLILGGTAGVLSLPAFLHQEIPPVQNSGTEAENNEKQGVLAFLGRADVRRLLPVLIAPTAFAFVSLQMRMPLLADLGVPSSQIGALLMCYGYPAGLLGTIFCGWLLNRFGPRTFMRLFSWAMISLAVYTVILGRQAGISSWCSGLLLSLDNILMGGVNVWGFTQMMRVSAGKYAGTGFAVLSSLFILVPLATAPFFGALGDAYGFSTLYLVLGVFILAGYGVAEVAWPACRGSCRT